MYPRKRGCMKKLLSLMLVFSLLFSISVSFADTNYKYQDGRLVRWAKPMLNICIKEPAYRLSGIEESVKYASDLWNSIDGIPKTRLNLNTYDCDIFIDYKMLPRQSQRYLATNTITNFRNGEISLSEINFNIRYDGQFGYASKSSLVYDIRSIVCHELGHALGLEGEPNNQESVMYEYTDLGKSSRRFLTLEDIRSIKKLYSGIF